MQHFPLSDIADTGLSAWQGRLPVAAGSPVNTPVRTTMPCSGSGGPMRYRRDDFQRGRQFDVERMHRDCKRLKHDFIAKHARTTSR